MGLWLNLGVGACWLIIALLVAFSIEGIWTRFGLVALGLLLALWRVQQVMWAEDLQRQSYIETQEALIINAATLGGMLILIAFFCVTLYRRR